MTPEECFEKYKHLDELLSDLKWLPDGFIGSIMLDLWQTIKAAQQAHEPDVLSDAEIEQAYQDEYAIQQTNRH